MTVTMTMQTIAAEPGEVDGLPSQDWATYWTQPPLEETPERHHAAVCCCEDCEVTW